MYALFADQNHPVLHETLMAAGFECDLAWDQNISEITKRAAAADILILRSRFQVTRELIDSCPRLKCIARIGAGLENIDVAYADSRNVHCLAVPEGNRDAVGEHTLGMLLMLLNNLNKADREVRQGIWLRTENRGHELKGRTVGIIGYGNMGSAFAGRLAGFGCKVLAHDKYKKNFSTPLVEECSLEVLMAQSDVISLHLPLTDETRYFIDKDFLMQCVKPVYIVNTSRGKCLNTEDLVTGLKSGSVLGACLDVSEYESTSFEKLSAERIPEPWNYLIHSEKVVLTPHIAGWTHESNFRMSQLMASKIIALFK